MLARAPARAALGGALASWPRQARGRLAFPPQPRTPAGAVAIFLVGCGVIAATTLDVARRMRDNEAPPSAADLQRLDAYKRELDRRAAQAALQRAAGER